MDTLGFVGGLWTLCLLSPLLFWGFDRMQARARRRRLRPTRQVRPSIGRDPPEVQVLLVDLARLETQFRRIDADNPPAKMHRLHAVNLAYDDVLCECCVAVGLPPPVERPLSGQQRLVTESELALRGLTW